MYNLHSVYHNKKMQDHISKFKTFYDNSSLNDYDCFKKSVPVLNEIDFSSIINQFIEKNIFKSCSFNMTSGTTGNSKLLANSLWRDVNKINYAAYFKRIISMCVLSKEDVVANLFTAGGFSTLYDGCNRLLESIGCSLLPIGRLDGFSHQAQRNMLSRMNQIGVDVLLGTPSSVIYLLKFSQINGINLNIKKIIFTGEPFSQEKRNYVKTIWTEAKIYGLYGHSETGFIGFNTDQCPYQYYHFFEDWFFLEVINASELLVTSYADTLMPIVRYQVGDKAQLIEHKCCCGIDLPVLSLQGRKDKKFNFAGNLINSEEIQVKLEHFFQKNVEFQIQLKTDASGQDLLNIILNQDGFDGSEYGQLCSAILQIDEIHEAIQKQAGCLSIHNRGQFHCTDRQKQPLIVDLRFEEKT